MPDSILPRSLTFDVPFTPKALALTALGLLALSGVLYLAQRS